MIVLLHAATAAALAAAASQQAQCEALISAWAGGNVRARIYAGATLLRTLTIGPWTINTAASPRKVVAGAGLADTAVAAGVQTRVVFELLDGTPVLELSAGATASGADINWQYGQIRALCRPTMAVELVADAGLPAIDLPAWLPDAGKFADASAETADADDPCPANNCTYSGTGGFASIWTAWNGGVFAPTLGSYGSMLCFGGGRQNYDGNEVVAYDLAARTWSLLSDPAPYGTVTSGDSSSANVNCSIYGSFPDDTPYPNHTYHGTCFLPSEAGGGALGSFVFMGHPQNTVNITTWNLWRFDLSTREWTRWLMPNNFGQFYNNALAYDSSRLGLWLAAPNSAVSSSNIRLWFIDFVAATVAQVGIDSAGAGAGVDFYYPAITYVPEKDCLVLVKSGSGLPLICLDLSGLGSTITAGEVCTSHTITQSGTKCPSVWAYPDGTAPSSPTDLTYLNYGSNDRLEYCERDGKLYALDLYNGTADADLYSLTPPAGAVTDTWTWAKETLTAQSSEALALRESTMGGVRDKPLMGRLRYVPDLLSFALTDADDLPVQLLRPAAFT